MKIKEIHSLSIDLGKKSELRDIFQIENFLKKKKEKHSKTFLEEDSFGFEGINNPYSDTRILNVADDKEIKKILVGIDIDPAELLLAGEIGNIDLVISHHPIGRALANLHEVMEMQCDVLSKYGVPINIAEGLMREKISEVARGLNRMNHQRTVDAARILKINLMCIHTPCDNLAAAYLKEKIEQKSPYLLKDLLILLKEIPEYKEALKIGAGPKIFVGNEESRCGKIALAEITGGTEGSPKIYEKMAQVGIGTVVGMHVSEEHKKEAESALVNIVVAGHISSDSLGVNLFLDHLEKTGIEIIPCSGLIRIRRA